MCAAHGCEGRVVRAGARGRPPIYCSPACRPSQHSQGGGATAVVVEVEPDDADLEDLEARRTFVVRLRRGQRFVVVARGVGRFSAAGIADELRVLFPPKAQQGGRATN